MTTTLLAPLTLALLHGGHGEHGDAPSLLMRLQHYLTEPGHLLPAALGALAVVALLVLLRRRAARR